MCITKRLYNLKEWAVIYRSTWDIVLTSGYDSFHGWYEYNDLVYDDDGNCREESNGGVVTPSDLIGDEYFN